jgi:hypothetical protein
VAKSMAAFVAILLLAGCSAVTFRGGPSKSQIKQDIASSMEQACMQPLKTNKEPYAVIDNVKFDSTKVYNNEATVHVIIEYHWLGGAPKLGQTFPTGNWPRLGSQPRTGRQA